MAEYRYYLIPDFMSHVFPQQFEEQAPTEFFSNTADLMKRYKQLREMPYNNEYTWNERTNLPYPRLTVGIDRRDPDGAVTIMQVRNGINYLCDDYRGPFADRNDKPLIEMAKQLVTAVGVDRIRPHYYTEENGHTKVHVGKDIHITEWANAPELCRALHFSRFLNRDEQQLFQVRNGQRIIENYADGSRLVKDVQTVDDTHFYVSNDADRAYRMLERNVADSTLQWAQPNEQMSLLQELVTQSAVYMAQLRLGLPVRDEDFPAFQSVSQFDTYQISLCLGGYLQAAAEPMLNAIGREALRLNRDNIAILHEPVHNESTPTQLNSREEAVTYDVHEEPRRLPDSEPFPAESAEPVSEPLREAASGISGAERAGALRPTDVGGHAADELQSNRTDSTADGGQDHARADADHPDAGPQDEPAGLGTVDQQPEEAGGGSSPSDAVRNLTESLAQAESEQALSAFALPKFPPTLLPQLLAAETSSRADNAEYLTFYNKNSLLIDRLRFVRESYKDVFTELLLADDTRVGFHRQDNGLLVWQGAYLTRSAETLLSWRAVANALNDLIEQHELIAAIDPKELPQAEEQLSFELPDGSPTSAEDDRVEKDDFLTPEKQETVIRSALPVVEYNAPQMDDASYITDEEINLALAVGSNFENSKFRIYQQFTTTQGDHAAFLKKEYGSGGRSWDYQSGAHGWVDHGPAGLKLILTNEEGRFERRLPWRAAAKRIAYLIEMQRFLTKQELEQYPAWAAEQREAASAVRDEPGNVPDTRPICVEGSVVYLEDDHRFTVERIGQFDVHLRDEEAPLFGRAISREEFQRQLDANPHNGGMMLSEQQHEALVQAQTEQALRNSLGAFRHKQDSTLVAEQTTIYLVVFSTHISGLALGNSLGAFRHKQTSTLVAEQTTIY